MYKMKFINNKWNPTFPRNTKSSCPFPLWELCALVWGWANTGSWKRCLWAWKSMISMLWASNIFFPLKILPCLSTAACLDLNIFNLSPLSFLHAPNTCITWVSNHSRNPWRHRAFHAQVATPCSCQKRNTTTHAISSHPNFHANKNQTQNQTYTLWVDEKKLLKFIRIHCMYYKQKSFPSEKPNCCSLSWNRTQYSSKWWYWKD